LHRTETGTAAASKVLLPELASTVAAARKAVDQAEVSTSLCVVAFFDLANSTAMKLSAGHAVGSRAAMTFTRMVTTVVAQCGGLVVKELGDGVLCRFSDPAQAVRAALNVKEAAFQLSTPASCGLTVGQVSSYQGNLGLTDMIGDTVDRCARIQAMAASGQVLIDQPMYEVVRSHLKDISRVHLGREAAEVETKGVGPMRLWEVSLQKLGVTTVATPFAVHAGGRLTIREKVQFMRLAREEVIEIGTGLTSFAKYFTGQKPGEFRDHLREFFKRGVSLHCYALDPTYEPGVAYLRSLGDDSYEQEMVRARELILRERTECIRLTLPGQLEYYTYSQVPDFHCLGVDVGDPMNGRILFSPYLGELSRAECPVHQLSRQSFPELYDKYLSAILSVRDASTLVSG
jgi:class 3 adenylate cyclase